MIGAFAILLACFVFVGFIIGVFFALACIERRDVEYKNKLNSALDNNT